MGFNGENGHLPLIYKQCSKMPLFFKLDFNKIELCVKLDILKIEFYIYIYIYILSET